MNANEATIKCVTSQENTNASCGPNAGCWPAPNDDCAPCSPCVPMCPPYR